MVIDFKNKTDNMKYNEQLKEAAIELSVISQDLFDMGLNLAMAGKWKDWNDSVTAGTTVYFDEEMLLDTGDDLVTRIVQLSLAVHELMGDINSRVKD